MIRTWRDDDARQLFERGKSKRVPQNIVKVTLRKLQNLDAATTINDLKANPGNRLNLHDRGEFAGYWCIRINDQYRLFFRWENGNAYEVQIDDSH